MQVRSLASETARQSENADRPTMAWFAADFQEEMSAFDGSLLVQLLHLLTCSPVTFCYAKSLVGAIMSFAPSSQLAANNPWHFDKPLSKSASQHILCICQNLVLVRCSGATRLTLANSC